MRKSMVRLAPTARVLATASTGLLVFAIAAASAPPSEPTPAAVANPAKEESLARYFPGKDLVVYLEFDGVDRHAEAWRKTAMRGILAETQTGAMLRSLAVQFANNLLPPGSGIQIRGAELVTVVEHAFRRGFAVGIVRSPGQRKPSLVGFVLRDAAGGEIRPIVAKLIDAGNRPGTGAEAVVKDGDRRVVTVRDPGGRGFAWWTEGSDLAVSLIAPEGADLMIAALGGRTPDATSHPVRAELAKAGGGFVPVGLAFFDMAALPALPPQAASLGLDRVKRLDYRWGFQDEALVTITRLIAPAPRAGLLALLDQPTFSRDELPPLPGGLSGFTAFSLDPVRILDGLAGLGGMSSGPRVTPSLGEVEAAIRETTGRDLRKDVLGPLGPKAVLYSVPRKINAPTNPLFGLARGLVHVPRTTLLVELRDADAFAATLDALVVELNKDLKNLAARGGFAGRGGGFGRPFGVVEERAMFETAIPPAAPIEVTPAQPTEIPKSAEPLEVPKDAVPKASVEPRDAAPAALVATIAVPGPRAQDQAEAEPPAPELRRLKEGRGYVLHAPASVLPLPAGLRPTVMVGKSYLAISTTPEAARAALKLEGKAKGLPEGDPLAKALDRLPDGMIFLSVSDARESMLPELIANLPNLAAMLGTGRFGGGMALTSRLFGIPMFDGPSQGGGPSMEIDPEEYPDPEAIRDRLFPATYVMSADDQGFQIVTREAFPSLNPAAIAPLALAAAIPAFQASRQAQLRATSTNNLKQIGLAMHNFHDVNGRFPADIRDADGKPLLSWRVAILPFVEQASLFNEFHMDEPWDSPHNKALLEKIPPTYQIPGATPANPGETFYRGFSGAGALFDPQGPQGTRLSEVTDGTSNTLGVVEARESVPWTKPDSEVPFEPGQPAEPPDPRPALGGHFEGGFNALFLDGSVRFIRDKVNPLVLRALITKNGGEVISADAF
jgi:prepilin-type processing-associated H-X9-DG protein